MEQKTAQIIFQPSGKRGHVPTGISIVEASRLLGVDIESPCGGMQICGKCKVKIVEGSYERYGITSKASHAGSWQEPESEHISEQERGEGFRLACTAQVEGDLLVYIPESSRAGKQVVSKAARALDIELDPAVKIYHVTVSPPSLKDPTGDFERVTKVLQQDHGLSDLEIDLNALRSLSGALRSGNWTVTVSIWMDQEIIRVRPGSITTSYGLAFDIGTTTIAGYLCDLHTGNVVETVSMMNPQTKYGEDVVSRISFHMDHADGLQRLSSELIAGLNDLVEKCLQARPTPHPTHSEQSLPQESKPALNRDDIEDVTVVCNTAMHHIFLQLDPESLGAIPFSPVVHQSLNLKARDLGLKVSPSAHIHVFPNEAGFVGGDNVGVILAEQPYLQDEIHLLIDIGTNGELVLGNKERLLCSSCATGPAMEGAHIAFGMRAAPGAIERVTIDPATKEVDYKVVGRDRWRSYSQPEEMRTAGICGSGIVDVLGELFKAGAVTKSGAFDLENVRTARLRKNPTTNMTEFVLAWADETSIGQDIVITQRDIRQIQLAKAAIYCGCKLMMRKLNIDKIDRVKIAGAFGTHVDRKLALIMGMFPDCPLDSVVSVGNAAGDGCRLALLNRGKRDEANKIARRVEYMELTLEPDFQDQLIEAIHLPHMKDEFPHLRDLVQ